MSMISQICIFDIQSDEVLQVFATEQHVEAPNWSADGDFLIVNAGGLIYRLPLSNPTLLPINTDFANRCNNDHGLSPDGTQLIISDATENGQSCIYTLPLAGGAPLRVTTHTPSYWHGWSPDGSTIAYAGKRADRFQIFTCPVNGGEETQLTFNFDHCDGPDYSADGNWIWFNAERDGSVQLWRMHTDGSGLEQMTFDSRVNWFPHPSPVGNHVCYLAYENGTVGHPANRPVQLRLMSAEGGTPRVLLNLYGGQGTINVPSWASDGKRFAFVQYQAG